jgi:predicted TIM-barrel fold metal-dependent hydrolase
MLPVEPVERAVAELERCAKMGMRGAMISIAQNPGYGSPMYEPLWSAAEDLQIPLSLHVAASRKGFTYTDNVFADFSLASAPPCTPWRR